MILTGKARLAGIMGWPVSHSRSPRLHGYWLQAYGIDGAYLPLAVDPERIEQALRALPILGFAGCNLTLPHKVKAMAVVDSMDGTARRIGAVNTIVVQGDGSLAGSNTDAFGFLECLKSDAPGWRPDQGPAVVLGAGGAARAVVAALVDAGVPKIAIVNRTTARAEQVARDIGGPILIRTWSERAEALAGAALLVNTTTQGMTGQPPLDIDLRHLPPEATVNDIVYVPLRTALLEAAEKRGNTIVDGLGMLLHQARPGFRAWFGLDPSVSQAQRDFVLADIEGRR
jgi:shikimate dehydrogenase